MTDQTKHLKLSSETFVMEQEDGYLVYAPLSGKISFVSAFVLRQLKSWIKDGESITAEEKAGLEEVGLLIRDQQLPFVQLETFAPTKLTLFPTSTCNLECVYCYASAGRTKKFLELDAAKAGIDFVVGNAVKKNTKEVLLSFHGGGEPTSNWPIVVSSTEYFREKAVSHGLRSYISLATNGVLSEEKVKWIMANIDFTQVSFDGPEDIQNSQRPRVSGKESFTAVCKTAKMFSEGCYNFGFRATITQESVGRLQEVYDFLASNFKPKFVHIEPLYECGRCSVSKWKAPAQQEFADNFLGLLKRLDKSKRIELAISHGNIDTVTSRYCGGCGNMFCITTEGYVSSCFQATLKDEPLSDVFFYGYFDKAQNKFVIDEGKRRYLNGRQTQNLPGCSDCFLKWNCAGDCPAKSLDNDVVNIYNTEGKDECTLNRMLAKKLLIEKLSGQTAGHHTNEGGGR